jgi:hypothetical protein
MGKCAHAARDGFEEPTEEKLERLGPGCFVQIKAPGESCCWVEITSIEDSGFNSIAHPALSDCKEDEHIAEGDQVVVNRKQITALGCDRFCFC